VPFVAALVISLMTARPPKRKKRLREGEDDDYELADDRPHRRSRERDESDEEEDRPRRRP
jgi:hypothetical protein